MEIMLCDIHAHIKLTSMYKVSVLHSEYFLCHSFLATRALLLNTCAFCTTDLRK